MSDIAQIQLITSVFWLVVIGSLACLFKVPISGLLSSLSRLNFAGGSFKFSDQRKTLNSYALLADTLVDILSQSKNIEELKKSLAPTHIQKLGTFAIRYTEEVDESGWNDLLLQNIAHLLLRFGYNQQSVDLINALLEKRQKNPELLNLKGLALMTDRLPEAIQDALKIYEHLVKRFPGSALFQFNYSLALSLMNQLEESVFARPIVLECKRK